MQSFGWCIEKGAGGQGSAVRRTADIGGRGICEQMSRNTCRIILASASPRRRELLALICPDFEVIPSRFNESETGGSVSARDHVAASAAEKARDVASGVSQGIVIGADTVVALNEHILGKPDNKEDAVRMLRLLSGKTHQVYTGIHVIVVRPSAAAHDHPAEQSAVECTDVRFRELEENTIRRYVATGEPLDKAGAYAIQGRGSVLIEGISGCFFNVVGLPIHRLSLILAELGLEVLACK